MGAKIRITKATSVIKAISRMTLVFEMLRFVLGEGKYLYNNAKRIEKISTRIDSFILTDQVIKQGEGCLERLMISKCKLELIQS